MSWLTDLTRYLIEGGPVMIPIGLCSIIALAAFLERLYALRRSRVAPRSLVRTALEHLRAGDWAGALAAVRASRSALGRVLDVAIQVRGAPRQLIKERLEEVGRREAAELERFVPIVGTIAAIAPLLGLLGTVGGMIATFAAIQEQGLGDIDKLAGGISQALITTFAGLSVGIPAVVANRFLLGRVDRLLIELEESSLTALELVSAEAGVEPGPLVPLDEDTAEDGEGA